MTWALVVGSVIGGAALLLIGLAWFGPVAIDGGIALLNRIVRRQVRRRNRKGE